jgi:hypothetical protein
MNCPRTRNGAARAGCHHLAYILALGTVHGYSTFSIDFSNTPRKIHGYLRGNACRGTQSDSDRALSSTPPEASKPPHSTSGVCSDASSCNSPKRIIGGHPTSSYFTSRDGIHCCGRDCTVAQKPFADEHAVVVLSTSNPESLQVIRRNLSLRHLYDSLIELEQFYTVRSGNATVPFGNPIPDPLPVKA